MKDFNSIIKAYERRGRSATIHGIKHSFNTKMLTGFGSPWNPTLFVASSSAEGIFSSARYAGDASPLKPLHVRQSVRYQRVARTEGLAGVANLLASVQGSSGPSIISRDPVQQHRVFYTKAHQHNRGIRFHESVHQMEALFQRLNPEAHSDMFGNFLSRAKKNKAFKQFKTALGKQSSLYRKFDDHKIGRELLAYYAQYKKYGSTGEKNLDSILARLDKDKKFFSAAEDLGIMEKPNKVIHHMLQQGGMKIKSPTLPVSGPVTQIPQPPVVQVATQQVVKSRKKVRLTFDLETTIDPTGKGGSIVSAAMAQDGNIVFEGAHSNAELFDINKFKAHGQTGKKFVIPLAGKKPAIFDQLEQAGFVVQGVRGPELSVTQGQKRYLDSVFQTQEHLDKYYKPSLKETKNLVSNEQVLVSNLADKITDIVEKNANVTLTGYNIEKFDIPKLINRLKAVGEHGRAAKLQKALEVIKIEDASELFQKAVNKAFGGASEEIRSTEVGRQWLGLNSNNKHVYGWSLDVAAETLGVAGRSAAGHGVQEDVKVAEAVFEALNKGSIVDIDKYADALEKFTPEGRKEEVSTFVTATRKGKNAQQAAQVQVEAINAATATQQVAESVTAPKNIIGEVTVGIEHKSVRMPKVNMPKGLFTKNNALIAGGLALGYFALKSGTGSEINNRTNAVFSSLNPFAGRQEYITSSFLGVKDESELYARINDPTLGDATRYKNAGEKRKAESIMEMGNEIHHNIQAGLLAKGIASSTEHYVEDPKNKVFGYVDVMKASGVPLEIKSTSLRSLSKMRAPQEEHISQANFYALATKSATAEILYVAKEDQSQTKLFTIQADSSRYLRDVQTIRQFQDKIGGISSKIFGFSNFRPASSWFGGGINYNMPYAHKADMVSQKAKLSNLPISQHMAQSSDQRNNHPSRAGV